MEVLDNSELWRNIPPEEKLELMAKAHASGILTALVLIVIGGTLAIGFQIRWLFWAAIIISPLVFQVITGKRWRDLRPRAMLEYLAARAAARRYAYIIKAEDLHLNFLFRGHMEHVFSDDEVMSQLEASVTNTKEATVWISLFGDALICMSEATGGAELQFGQVLNEKIDLISPEGEQYTNNRELIIKYHDKQIGERKLKLTSKYPAALIVFEKKLEQTLEIAKNSNSSILDSLDEELA